MEAQGFPCFVIYVDIFGRAGTFVHERISPNPLLTLRLAMFQQEYINASTSHLLGSVTLQLSRVKALLAWVLLPYSISKLNYNAYFCSYTNVGGICIMAHDQNRRVVCRRGLYLLGNDVLTVEGQAMFHAFLTTRRMGFDNVIVELDCLNLHVRLSTGLLGGPW